MSDSISFKCLKLHQPIGDFYIGVIDSRDLCEITFVDVRRIEKEREIETYLGIQRPLNDFRVKEIRDYVKTVDACFPTAVILAVDADCVEINEETGLMTIKSQKDDGTPIDQRRVARVLDGQHRIEGLRDFQDVFSVNISIFVDIDIAEQAYIFSTVNLAQTKVNKSLVYDLHELATTRSPEKLCHSIAVTLNDDKESPFYHRIKRLGVSTEGIFTETITQATFVSALIKYMSVSPLKDRDIYKRGGLPERVNVKESQNLFLRNMMISNRDYEITDILWNYFNAVQNRWPKAWNEGGQGVILNRTNGFKALMRLLKDAYLSLYDKSPVPSEHDFFTIFERIKIDDDHFNINNFKPGSSGESELYTALYNESGLNKQIDFINDAV